MTKFLKKVTLRGLTPTVSFPPSKELNPPNPPNWRGKRIIFLLSLFFLFLSLVVPAKAAENFETNFDITYEINTNGITSVIQNISLVNKTVDVYASEYNFSIGSTRTQNITAHDSAGNITPKIQVTNNTTEINLIFNQKIVGKNETLNFSLHFESLDFANKNGQVWEIAIPKMSKAFEINKYDLRLIVPNSFQDPSYILPSPIKSQKQKTKTIYFFQKESVLEKGISAAFGSHQIMSFDLKYHLKNPHKETVKTEIALPPETIFQKIFYQEINPEPINVIVDDDGNWLATYLLNPNSEVEVRARGTVELFLNPRADFPREKIKKNEYLKAQKFWEVNEPEIKNLAVKLKTPQEIYEYVSENLIYDYGKVTKPIGRRGALEALKNKSSAICTEFTDLFIALARAANIPAREVNGYAYTTNPSLKPLSLDQDILHAWPEYYDEKLSLWLPIDPTWGKTTGGVDFFSKLDLNHFVFAFHGLDSNYPYPAGSYKLENQEGKDIFVKFGNLPKTETELVLESRLPKNIFSGLSLNSSLILKNKSNYSFLNQTGEVYASSGLFLSKGKFSSKILPPYGELEIPIKVKPTGFFKSSEEIITVIFAGQTLQEKVKTQPIFLMPFQYFSYPLVLGLILGLVVIKLSQWLVKKYLH